MENGSKGWHGDRRVKGQDSRGGKEGKGSKGVQGQQRGQGAQREGEGARGLKPAVSAGVCHLTDTFFTFQVSDMQRDIENYIGG